jgi:hypothetical protein
MPSGILREHLVAEIIESLEAAREQFREPATALAPDLASASGARLGEDRNRGRGPAS